MIRKFFLALTGLVLFCSNAANAQYLMGGANGKDSTLPKIEFGVKAGLSLQTITGSTWDGAYKPGIEGGIYVGMHKKKVGVRIEVGAHTTRYTSKDTSLIDSNGNKGDFRATYIDIPILFEYNIFSRIWLQVGPQYSNFASLKSLNGFGDAKMLFKTGEFSGVLGLEGRFAKNISGGIRYILGLTDMDNTGINYGDVWKNNAIQLYAGYRIK